MRSAIEGKIIRGEMNYQGNGSAEKIIELVNDEKERKIVVEIKSDTIVESLIISHPKWEASLDQGTPQKAR